MIDLAPHNPNGLQVRTPVLLAPNCGAALRWSGDVVGAIATDVASVRPARGGATRWGTVPAGVVFERLPTTPFPALLRAERKRWARSPVPVLVALRGTPAELGDMVLQLETIEGVAGLVLLAAGQATRDTVATVRAVTALPILPVLGLSSQLADDAVAAVEAGADALVLCSYPLAAAQTGADLIDGLLVGPALLPWTLRALHQARSVGEVPLLAWGGVADAAAAQACLAAGASAVLVDGALYGDPFAAQRIGTIAASL